MRPFNEVLKEWTDIDIAQHLLAIQIGFLKEEERFIPWKGFYFTDNKFSQVLGGFLSNLVDIGFLEYNEELDQVRINSTFKYSLLQE